MSRLLLKSVTGPNTPLLPDRHNLLHAVSRQEKPEASSFEFILHETLNWCRLLSRFPSHLLAKVPTLIKHSIERTMTAFLSYIFAGESRHDHLHC